VIEEGEVLELNAEADGQIFWTDDQENILNVGSTYVTDPILESTMLYVYQEEVVIEGIQGNVGEEEHVCGGTPYCDYSGGEYNSYLLFDCLSPFSLNSVKVYANNAGQRTIELRSSDGVVLNSVVAFVPESENDGYVINLNWNIELGYGYQIGTNTEMNLDNFGENNPGFKRTTAGQEGAVLTNYPYQFEDVVEITSSEYGPEYYYYFYDWNISTPDQTCISESVPVQITIHQTGLEDFENSEKLIGIFDVLGRDVSLLDNQRIYLKLFKDGSVQKVYLLD